MSVHYKFKSAVEYDTLPVDGLNISLGDLKEAIIQQKRLGKGQPYDLQITNAETKEVYVDEKILIPKNSSLIVARVPIDPSHMKRPWENKESTALILSNPSNLMNTEDAAEAAEIDRKIKEVTDLTRMEGTEQDKINAMVAQSTMEYHPSRYVKLRVSRMTGKVPISYKCYKCNQNGHWVTMCPLNNQDLRKSTGIPSMFLEEVEDATAPGVMISATGKLVRLRETAEGKKSTAPNTIQPVERMPLTEDLECKLCHELLKDAVLIPCCAEAFCDECIRNHLLDSEDHICPACKEEGIGPDTLIPNRYLRIKVKQFECGWFKNDRRTEVLSDVSRAATITPTPPQSPAHVSSPVRIRILDTLVKSPSSQHAVSPVPERTPPRVAAEEPVRNGSAEPEDDVPAFENAVTTEIRDAISDNEFIVPGEEEQEQEQEDLAPEETKVIVEEKEDPILSEVESNVDEKHKKVKKKKAKRKSSRHHSESDEEREEKKRKKKERSHKSQDKKSKRHGADTLKDVDDLPRDAAAFWDDHTMESQVQEKEKIIKSSPKDALKDVSDGEDAWSDERIVGGPPPGGHRSRSNSGDKKPETVAVYDNIVPFNPHVPPPNFVKSPPKGYPYPVTTSYLPTVPPPVPGTSESTYPHYQPGVIDDPLVEFEKAMRKKDERDRKWKYGSRSRSPSRSPRYRRVRSRSRHRTWSRSRSRSVSRPRLGVSTRSPLSQSRKWSRSPPTRGLPYRSRSPSFSRDRSPPPNRSLSLSRTPSPRRRSPLLVLPVHPPVHPDPHVLARPPMDYGIPRDYNRFPINTLPHDQFQHPPPQHPPPYLPIPPAHWEPHTRYNRGRPNFRGRGRGRGGFRPGENFDPSQDYNRHEDYRPPHMDDRHMGMPDTEGWDRDVRPSFNREIPRNDRGNRHYDNDRRRFGDGGDYDAGRSHRLDDSHPPNTYSDEDDWKRYGNDGKKRDDDQERRRYDSRRGRDDRKDDSEYRKTSGLDEFDDYKRTRKEGDFGKSYDRGGKDDGRSSSRHDRDGKHKRRESPRDDDLHYRGKSYDSPGKSHKKSSPRDRREKEGDRRERDLDRKDRDVDKRDGDRRDRDSDRRTKDMDRRERDDRRDWDSEKPESDRKEKDYDRKESSKREKDQDRKGRDVDRKDKDSDRRDRETSKRDKESSAKDKGERNEEKREKPYVSRWDHNDLKSRSDKESKGPEKQSKSSDRERSSGTEDKEHKRKSKHRDEKEEGHSSKEKGEGDPDCESLSKAEKKRHDKKKKKKEKRRASQASTEASQVEASGDEAEDRKKKKKRERKRKAKGGTGEAELDDMMDSKHISMVDGKLVDMLSCKLGSEERLSKGDSTKSVDDIASENAENDSEMTPDGKKLDSKEGDEASALLPLPPLSKWERDEDLTLTPKGLLENKVPEEEKKVTVDILKRAENTIFSGRGLVTRKVFLETQKQQKEMEEKEKEKEKSPTPEWDRVECREAKRRGPSIQITISSKTESQIGRPKAGKHQPGSPEQHSEGKRYSLRTRRNTDSDSKSDKVEKHSRRERRSQSPSEPQSTRTRRRSEKEMSKDLNDEDGHLHKKDVSGELFNSNKKCDDAEKMISTAKGAESVVSPIDTKPDAELRLCEESKSGMQMYNDLQNTECKAIKKGIKRASSSADELEVKKVKIDSEPLVSEVVRSATVSIAENSVQDKQKFVSHESEPNYGIPVLGGTIVVGGKNLEKFDSEVASYGIPVLDVGIVAGEKKSDTLKQHSVTNSNIITVPLVARGGDDLEEGEIPSEASHEDGIPDADAPVVDAPLELRGAVEREPTVDDALDGPSSIRYSPIRVPTSPREERVEGVGKVKEKTKKRKKRKRSSSSSSSNSSSSSSSSSSSDEEEIVKKKKKKKKKKKAAVLSESSDGESQRKHKKKKKDKKKKKKKGKKKSDK